MGRTENVQVFQDTEMLCKTNQILIESTKNSVKNQKVILEGDELPEIDKNRFEQDAELIVSKKRTYEAASAYKELKTAVHNFASASNPCDQRGKCTGRMSVPLFQPVFLPE